MSAVSVDRLRHDLGVLEATANRAGIALACSYSSAAEYEAEIVRERRAAGAFSQQRITRMRLMLAATAVMSLAALMLLIS